MFEVRQPIAIAPDMPDQGLVISRHRSLDAAQRAIANELRVLRKLPGQQNSYVQRYVWDVETETVCEPGTGTDRQRLTEPTASLTITVAQSVRDALGRLADARGCSVSAVAAEMIRDGIDAIA